MSARPWMVVDIRNVRGGDISSCKHGQMSVIQSMAPKHSLAVPASLCGQPHTLLLVDGVPCSHLARDAKGHRGSLVTFSQLPECLNSSSLES